MTYMYNINTIDDDKITNTACKYLYFWLSNDLFNNEKSTTEIKQFYKSLLLKADDLIFDKNLNEICNEQCSEDTYKNLKDLYDMNINLNEFKVDSCKLDSQNKCKCADECTDKYMTHENTCKSGDYPDFCNELEKIRRRYNDEVKIEVCGSLKHPRLPSFQSYSLSVIILIPVIIIFVASFIFFALYKFTPWGSRLRRGRRKVKNTWSDVDEARHKLSFEPYRNNQRLGQYNISYYSS